MKRFSKQTLAGLVILAATTGAGAQTAWVAAPGGYATPYYGGTPYDAYSYYGYGNGYALPGYDAYGQGAYGYAQDPYAYSPNPYGTTAPAPYAAGQAPAAAPQAQAAAPATAPYAGYGGQGYAYPQAVAPYGYGAYPYPFPRKRKNKWDDWDFFGGDNPLQNPLDHEGYWADPRFRPWRTGPFAYDKWEDHPMKNMPWGDFPGWGEGFFGNFGPDQWKGITPWGNDVPFKWIDPSDPEESIANMWEDAINTPNAMGRMPPGFTMPYISVPNPIDVENEFERNARNAPTEFRNMWSEEGAGFGAKPAPKKSSNGKGGKDGKPAAKDAQASGKDGAGQKAGGKPPAGADAGKAPQAQAFRPGA
ncbi:MAG TPA: hypothetical protein ENJ94_03835 [Gammaproteobacteria bacterium]|nr:hypothetical protein [Gammaproteobacteria bacterium]